METDRRSRCPLARFALVITILLLGACGSSEQNASTEQDLGSGRELYAQNCASCHGTDLRGTSQGPSHLSEVYEPGHHPDAAFRSAIAEGVRAHHWNFGDMAPVPGLDDDEVDAIIAYVREQQEAQGLEPYPPGPA